MDKFFVDISGSSSEGCYGCDSHGNVCNWGAGNGQTSEDTSSNTAPTQGCYGCDSSGNGADGNDK